VVLPAALREMFSSLVYLSIMCWMLLSLNREATARPGLPEAGLSSIQELCADGEETSRKCAPRPGFGQCPSDGDLSAEEGEGNRL